MDKDGCRQLGQPLNTLGLFGHHQSSPETSPTPKQGGQTAGQKGDPGLLLMGSSMPTWAWLVPLLPHHSRLRHRMGRKEGPAWGEGGSVGGGGESG